MSLIDKVTGSVSDDRPPSIATVGDTRIEIIDRNEDFLVLIKPCNLRSVPGNISLASDSRRPGDGAENGNEEPLDGPNRLTAQQGWLAALNKLRLQFSREKLSDRAFSANALLRRLVHDETRLVSIPRKLRLFELYVSRNRRRLMQAGVEEMKLDIVHEVFDVIEKEQRRLMNLRPQTQPVDSAFGQATMLAHEAAQRGRTGLFVVHRLDCETSGLMVLARSHLAASSLCRAWRERSKVTKKYLAHVSRWPPYENNGVENGTIEVPIAPADPPRWAVAEDKHSGKKDCITIWRILSPIKGQQAGFLLELTPVTGRTHQLRLHTAHVGSGILGDSLYGEAGSKSRYLRLHAWKLSFPHPSNDDLICSYENKPPWVDGDTQSELSSRD